MGEFVVFFVSLFSIVNPFSSIPTFVGLTGGIERAERRRMITQTSFAVFVILATSYLTGQALLRFFSISVPSLRVAGGLVILGMAWSMLHARISGTKQTPEEAEESAGRPAIAVVPIAMPLLAGPGSISLMIIAAGRATGFASHGIALLATLSLSVSVWLILQAAGPIAETLGKTGMNVATRFMGLILAATAIEFITSGLGEIFPGWIGGMGA
ncbi:MAG: NAAT family transporter [Gemmatimonadetes bacterium]|nr:NAAT family transporter [Gemmatimonadota bacterium]MDA1104574.1 NAAT family transporter [Gemmatimonadota bacterium]